MTEDIPSPKTSSAGAPSGHSLRRALTVDESAIFRQRPSGSRFSNSGGNLEAPSTGAPRRRSSNFSEYSLSEVRKQLQSSTDDLLLPRPSRTGYHAGNEHAAPSHWHSAPLAFALLPAIGGMLFQNGSAVVTDVILLGLAAIFLNWSVRLPWDWYHSAQAIRTKEEYNSDLFVDEESGEENNLDASRTSLDEVPEEVATSKKETKKPTRHPDDEKASNELYVHELLALFSCFLFPIIGAYLLHSIRGYLSRPSEGLVSNYNLTIFLLASELRPMSHLVKLIQSRTLHLQRLVNSNPYAAPPSTSPSAILDLTRRLSDLEARALEPTPTPITATPTTSEASSSISSKQAALLTTEVRRSLQPDLDALTRAVRRYEKRATLQTMQTESRLLDLEARLGDAISLAAAAAAGSRPGGAAHGHHHGFWARLVEWVAAGVVLPLQAFGALAAMPFRLLSLLVEMGRGAAVLALGTLGVGILGAEAAVESASGRKGLERGRKVGLGRVGAGAYGNGNPIGNGRLWGERLQGKGSKR